METIEIAKVLLFMLVIFGVALLVLCAIIATLYDNIKHLNENIYRSINALHFYDTFFSQVIKESAKSYVERNKK